MTETRNFIQIPQLDIIQELEREMDMTQRVIDKNEHTRKTESYLTKIYHFECAIKHLLGQELPDDIWLFEIAKTIRAELDMRLMLYPKYIQQGQFSRDQANLQYARLRAALAIVQRKHILIIAKNTPLYRKGILNVCLTFAKEVIYINENQLTAPDIQSESILVWEDPSGGEYLFKQLRQYGAVHRTKPPILIVTTDYSLLELYLKGYSSTIGIFNCDNTPQHVVLSKIKLDYPELFYDAK